MDEYNIVKQLSSLLNKSSKTCKGYAAAPLTRVDITKPVFENFQQLKSKHQ